MKFDTLDKKPKLYDLLIMSVTVAAALAVMELTGIGSNTVMCVILDVYYAAALAMLGAAFVRQLRYNPYSYNTIFYAGFSFFVVYLLIAHITATVRTVAEPEIYANASIVHLTSDAIFNYMFFTFPFIAVFSAALCISNISLLIHEGKRIVNLLGIALSFLLVGGEIFMFFFNFYVSGSEREVMIHSIVSNVIGSVYLYFECMIIGSIIANLIVLRHEPEYDRDYMIILGCGMRSDGTPTPLLRGRVDRAVEFSRRQSEATGRQLTFVTSGGKGANEPISECECMRRYLISQGIPEERIVEEDRSTTTFENMKFSKAKILERDHEAKIAFSTTNYHVFRSGIFARRVKMRAVGVGAKTKWYFWPNAAVREFVGLVTEHRGKQLIIIGSLIAAYVVLTVVSFR